MTTGEIILDALIIFGILLTLLKGILWGREERKVLKLYGSAMAAEHIRGYKEMYEDAMTQLKAAKVSSEEVEMELHKLENEYHELRSENKLILAGKRSPKISHELDFSPLKFKASQASDSVQDIIRDIQKKNSYESKMEHQLATLKATEKTYHDYMDRMEKKISRLEKKENTD